MSRFYYNYDALDSLVNCDMVGEDRHEAEKLIKQDLSKLEKLKNLEEELGCPLEVVFKALKEGIFVKDEWLVNTAYSDELYNKKYKRNEFTSLTLEYFDGQYSLSELDSPYNDLECGEVGCFVYLNDYGKTWWLKGEKNE